MSSHLFDCNKCGAVLPPEMYNTSRLDMCSSCGTPVRIDVFPALFRPIQTGVKSVSLPEDDVSSCYYHPQKKAAIPCETCGRFLCSLCDIEFNDRHLCPSCIETGRKKRKIKNLENHRVLYDRIAFFLSVAPILLFWVTIITAPASIIIAIRHWKSPLSIIPRTRVRYILAIFFSSLQIGGWMIFFSKLIA